MYGLVHESKTFTNAFVLQLSLDYFTLQVHAPRCFSFEISFWRQILREVTQETSRIVEKVHKAAWSLASVF
jgi:hypothetical protein